MLKGHKTKATIHINRKRNIQVQRTGNDNSREIRVRQHSRSKSIQLETAKNRSSADCLHSKGQGDREKAKGQKEKGRSKVQHYVTQSHSLNLNWTHNQWQNVSSI